jgi:DNA-binding response OmpR family regulator
MPPVRIMVVDDNPFMQSMIVKSFESGWEPVLANSGEQCLQLAVTRPPDLILLDIEMHGMNGYMTCDQIRQQDVLKKVPIIFISAHANVRDRLQGYEVGADDYLVKPFEAEELRARIRVLLRYHTTQEVLHGQVENASATAMVALRGSGELGMAIQFIESTYDTYTLQELGRRFLKVTGNLGLNCTLMFVTGEGQEFHARAGEIPPIERDLITLLHERGQRFNDFGCRTQINYPRVALLVKNMPLEDPAAYGRYKDFLPTLLGTTDAKVRDIETEHSLIRQTRHLIGAFDNVKDTLISIAASIDANQRLIMKTLRTNLGAMDNHIPVLGLEEDQEQFLLNSIDTTLREVGDMLAEGENIRMALQTVPLMLKNVSDCQQALLDKVIAKQQPANGDQSADVSDAESTGGAGDIELF